MKTKYLITILILALIGFFLSAYLAEIGINDYLDISHKSICNFNEYFNCDVVARSDFSSHFGIPNFIIGLIFYFVIIATTLYKLLYKDKFLPNFIVYIFWVSLLSVIGSIYLFIVSSTIIKSFCIFCMGVYIVNILMFLVTFMAEKFSLSHLITTLSNDVKTFFISPTRTGLFIMIAIFALLLLYYFNSHPILSKGAQNNLTGGEKINIDYSRTSQDRLVTGPATAPALTVMVFTDYECPFCSKASFEVKKLLKNNPDLRLIFKDYPLDQSCNYNINRPFHEYACKASISARCAAEQGKFWEYHDLLFENQGNIDENSFMDFAQSLNLDMKKFETCVNTAKPIDKIITDIDEAGALGVNATPTFFFEGRKEEGYKRYEELQKIVDEVKLKKQKEKEEYERQKAEWEKKQKQKGNEIEKNKKNK